MRLWAAGPTSVRPWTARAHVREPQRPGGTATASPRGARAAIVDVIADSLVGIWE